MMREQRRSERLFNSHAVDGRVNLENFQAVCRELYNHRDEAQSAAAFHTIDKNDDGSLSYEEFQAWFKSGSWMTYTGKTEQENVLHLESSKKLANGKRLSDARKSFIAKAAQGVLDPGRFQDLVYSQGYYLTEDETRKAFNSLDTNSDGSISFEEYYKWWKENADNRFTKLKSVAQNESEVEEWRSYVGSWFSEFDHNRRGSIDYEQFRQVYGGLFEESDPIFPVVKDTTFEAVVEVVDKDRDGSVSLNEFVDWYLEAIGESHLREVFEHYSFV
jgi:Ca2+-binding EF-hand superfamily protein